MNPILEEVVVLDFIVSSATGAATDADSTPTAEVFEDATDTAILSPTATKRTGKTGDYRISVACTAANGFEAGKSYNVVVAATVGGVAAKAVVGRFQVRSAAVVGGDTPGTTTLLTRLTAQRGTNLDSLDATVSSRSTFAGGAVASVTDPVTVGLNTDKAGYALGATGLDAISTVDPGAPAAHTTIPRMLVALWRAMYKKNEMSSTQAKRYADNGTTVNATAGLSDNGTVQTIEDFS